MTSCSGARLASGEGGSTAAGNPIEWPGFWTQQWARDPHVLAAAAAAACSLPAAREALTSSKHHCRCFSSCFCRAVVGVIAALGSLAPTFPASLAQRQGGNGGTAEDDLLFKTAAVYCTCLLLLTGEIRDSGQLAQLSDADALRFGSGASLAVRAMPGGWVQMDGGVAGVYTPCCECDY